MANPRIEKFSAVERYARCPLCHSGLHLAGTALRCEQGHSFDVSARGYANFLPGQRPLKGYDRPFFQHRRALMERGLYRHVEDMLIDALSAALPRPGAQALVIDAGCGEGTYARAVHERLSAEVVGIDIAKDACHVAAGGGGDVLWIVGDVANLPLADRTADAVIDAFTPANYREFSRVLKPGGVLAKIVPGAAHMHEVRAAARSLIRSEAYSNRRVVGYFDAHFSTVEHARATRTVELAPDQVAELLRMTPVLFDVAERDIERLSRSIDRVTIDAELLVGRR